MIFKHEKFYTHIENSKNELTCSSNSGLFQKKSTPTQRKACWKISQEGGLTTLEIQTGGGL